MDNLLSVPEVAKRLGGISKWTVYRFLSQGNCGGPKWRRTMIRESELANVIREGEQIAPSEPGKVRPAGPELATVL